MAPKTQPKAIFVDVEHEPSEVDEPEPAPEVKVKKPLSEDRLAKLAAARLKATAACKIKWEKARAEKKLMKTQKDEMDAMRKAEIDSFLAKKKKDAVRADVCPDPEARAASPKTPKPESSVKNGPSYTRPDGLTPEMKAYLRMKSQKYVQQAMMSHQATAAAPPLPKEASPAGDIKMLAKGRVVSYLTEETLQQAMNSIFPNGRYT